MCHGWAGNGSPKDPARPEALIPHNRDGSDTLMTVFKCGLPGTSMPFFDQYLYTDDRCYGMTAALSGDEADPEAANLVRSLVNKIVLTPRDGKLQVDLAGDLAAILAMATNKKPAGNEPDGMVQVKMVAGARNPRGMTRPFVVV